MTAVLVAAWIVNAALLMVFSLHPLAPGWVQILAALASLGCWLRALHVGRLA